MSQSVEKSVEEGAPLAEEDQKPAKFSEYLSSPIITVVVSDETSARTFYLHSRLLVRSSRYFEAALRNNRFTEGQENNVKLEDIDPSIFGLFVDWLYRDGWAQYTAKPNLHETEIYLLARTYVLGERLMAADMQNAAADIIYKNLDGYGNGYSDTAVCDLLEIVEMGIGDPDDPLADRILWLAVQRLQQLQQHDRFECLIQEHKNLAMQICMRAGSRNQSSGGKTRRRFKKEGMY